MNVDASNIGMGAVLGQIQHGQEKVIAYASKAFSQAQRCYCTNKRQLLVVVQFMGVVFRH